MLLQQLTVDLKYDWENVRAESWYYAKFPTEDDHIGHPLRGEVCICFSQCVNWLIRTRFNMTKYIIGFY